MGWWFQRQKFWRAIPNRELIHLLFAAGLTFSSMGFLSDIVSLSKQPFSSALYSAAVSGLTVVCIVLALARDARWLAAGLLLQVAGAWFIAGPARLAPWAAFAGLSTETRLQIDSAGALFAVISGYNAFIVFISRAGQRQAAVTTELALAQRIHQTLVPEIRTAIGPTAFHGLSRPSGQVGGDLVDVIELPDGEWLAYVADVSGHGVSSGLIMAMVKSAVRMAVLDAPALPVLVDRLNRMMCGQIASGMYVTLAAIRGGIADRAEVLIAGHPPLLRVARDRPDVDVVSAAHVPIGFSPEWTFTSAVVPFRAGDVLVLITDGLFEVFNAADQDLGIDSVKETLLDTRGQLPAVIADRVFRRARTFGPQLDDQTILLITRTGPDAAAFG